MYVFLLKVNGKQRVIESILSYIYVFSTSHKTVIRLRFALNSIISLFNLFRILLLILGFWIHILVVISIIGTIFCVSVCFLVDCFFKHRKNDHIAPPLFFFFFFNCSSSYCCSFRVSPRRNPHIWRPLLFPSTACCKCSRFFESTFGIVNSLIVIGQRSLKFWKQNLEEEGFRPLDTQFLQKFILILINVK